MGVFVVVAMESKIITNGLKGIRPTITIGITDTGQLRLLGDDDSVAFIILDADAQRLESPLCKE